MTPLTPETLQERLKKLRQDRDQALANLNSILGAIQVLEQILVDLEKPDSP